MRVWRAIQLQQMAVWLNKLKLFVYCPPFVVQNECDRQETVAAARSCSDSHD
jgi:hypothetical protein